jgi:hypothetical protein
MKNFGRGFTDLQANLDADSFSILLSIMGKMKHEFEKGIRVKAIHVHSMVSRCGLMQ